MFVMSDFDSFICGFAYGVTTVVVGQPLDTIKTRMQAKGTGCSMISTATSIFKQEGVSGLYRGNSLMMTSNAADTERQILANFPQMCAIDRRNLLILPLSCFHQRWSVTGNRRSPYALGTIWRL